MINKLVSGSKLDHFARQVLGSFALSLDHQNIRRYFTVPLDITQKATKMNNPSQPSDIHFSISPVGYVENNITRMTFSPHGNDTPEERRRQVQKHREETRNTISTLTLLPQFEPLLDGIEDFSHIVVIYWPHRLSPEDRQIKKVHPMGRKEIPLKGVFSTRSPARPNPLLISTVRLLERKGHQLRVQGLEALDKSPIMDIKPMTNLFDDGEAPTFPDWITDINKDLNPEE